MTEGVQTAEGVGEPPAEAAATATECGPFFHRSDWVSCGVTAVVTLAVYLWTLAPDVTLEFSGSLATAANYGGVANPPGFPAWTVYAWFFTKLLPFSNIAWRMAVGSAVAGAMMCGLVALMVSRGGLMLLEKEPAFSDWNPKEQNRMRVVCGWVAGMALGLSTPVWSEAVIVATWTFGDLLFTVVLCLLMRWSAAPAKRTGLYWALFVFGISLTGNQEFIVISPAILLTVLICDRTLGRDLYGLLLGVAGIAWLAGAQGCFPFLESFAYSNRPLIFALLAAGVAVAVRSIGGPRPGSDWRPAMRCLGCLLAGLAVYFWLPVVSMANPPMNWAYPRTVEGFFHLLSRGQYDWLNPTDDWARFASQLWVVAKDTGGGFGWLYCLFAAVPPGLLWRIHGASRRWLQSLTAMFLCTGPLLIATLNPGSDLFYFRYLRSYYIAMQVVLAVWTGLGLAVIGSFAIRPRKATANPPPFGVPGKRGGWD